jgi:hypothetical protein
MSIAAVFASAFLSFHPHLSWPSDGRTHIGLWTYQVGVDRFTGLKSCRLSARHVSYAHQALTFQFASKIDTSESLYRLDGGPAQSWRVNAMTLASAGVALHDDSLVNPSQGLVRIPAHELANTGAVTIRATPRSRPVKFHIEGFAAALAAAEAAGCAADRFY